MAMGQGKATSAGGTTRGLTLEQWIALNDEIRGLARAGLPLEAGLASLGQETSGQLAAISRDLARRLEQGESLQQAVEAERGRLPGVYGAVVEAGVRSGRLAAALQSLAEFGRSQLELRRAVNLAMIYPLILVVAALALFVTFAVLVVPRFLAIIAEFRLPVPAILRVLDVLGRSAGVWVPVLAGLLVVGVVAWLASGRARSLAAGRGTWLIRWFPWTRRLLDDTAAASLAEMLALLVEHGVPFPRALELAGEASGHPGMRAEAMALAEAARLGQALRASQPVRRAETLALGEAARAGEPLGAAVSAGRKPSGGLPGILRWMIGTGYRDANLVQGLRSAAASYRRHAAELAEALRTALPVLVLVVVGGITVLLYGLTLFLPLSQLLHELTQAR
jgi:general secretion pathway protein F